MSIILPNGAGALDTDSFDEGFIYGNPTDGRGRDFMESIARDRNCPVYPAAAAFNFGIGWQCAFIDGYPSPNFRGFMGWQTPFAMFLQPGGKGASTYGGTPVNYPPDPHITGIPITVNNEGFFQFTFGGYFFDEDATCNMQYLAGVLPGRFQLTPGGGANRTQDVIKIYATAPAGSTSPTSQVLLYTVGPGFLGRTGAFAVNGAMDTFDSIAAFGAVPWSVLFVATHLGLGLSTFWTTQTADANNNPILTPGLSPLAPAVDFNGNSIHGPGYFLTAFPGQNPPASAIPSLNSGLSGTPMV